jgi:hypothetical protein
VDSDPAEKMMNLFMTVLGACVMLAPLLLILAAWVMYRNRREPLISWRRKIFLVTLAVSVLNYALVFLDILVVPHLNLGMDRILTTYARIGRTGELFSIALFASALAGTGAARVCAILGAIGVLCMWIGVGFYSF